MRLLWICLLLQLSIGVIILHKETFTWIKRCRCSQVWLVKQRNNALFSTEESFVQSIYQDRISRRIKLSFSLYQDQRRNNFQTICGWRQKIQKLRENLFNFWVKSLFPLFSKQIFNFIPWLVCFAYREKQKIFQCNYQWHN